MPEHNTEFPPPHVEDRSPEAQTHRPAPPALPASTPPAPYREKGGFSRGFGIGSGIGLGLGAMALLTALAVGVMTIIGTASLVASSAGAATTSLTTIWGDGSQTLRAVSVNGPIMADASDGALLAAGTYGYEVAQQIDELTADDASGLVLLVNTPGGSIGGSRAISDAVERYQERTEQPVLVHVSSMSASGGVYATATADEIIADHGALVGSIGVIFGPFDQYEGVVAIDGGILGGGVTTTGGITSDYLSQGTSKDFGNPFREMTDEERAHYMAGLEAEYENFVTHVSEHRGIPEQEIVDELGAFLFDASRAQDVGLTDGTMGRDEFFRHAAESAGLDPDDTRVEAAAAPSAWEALLGAKRTLGEAPVAEQGPGVAPTVSQQLCDGRQPLAWAGDLSTVCGG